MKPAPRPRLAVLTHTRRVSTAPWANGRTAAEAVAYLTRPKLGIDRESTDGLLHPHTLPAGSRRRARTSKMLSAGGPRRPTPSSMASGRGTTTRGVRCTARVYIEEITHPLDRRGDNLPRRHRRPSWTAWSRSISGSTRRTRVTSGDHFRGGDCLDKWRQVNPLTSSCFTRSQAFRGWRANRLRRPHWCVGTGASLSTVRCCPMVHLEWMKFIAEEADRARWVRR